MRDWCVLPSADELLAVPAATETCRDKWASIRPPFPAAFDGSFTDARALDYMDYEGIEIPGGIESAALVCGEVLRRAAGLDWVISYLGDWFVASRDELGGNIAICPLARLLELEFGGSRGSGLYTRFIQKAAFDCLLLGGPAMEDMAREFLGNDGDYLESVEMALEQIKRANQLAQHKKRRR